MEVLKERGGRVSGGGSSSSSSTAVGGAAASAYDRVRHLAERNAVVVFSLSSCCMCHVAKQLLFGLGVGPTVIELDEEMEGGHMEALLRQLSAGNQHLPVVFVGGRFLGGVDTLMASHINGSLVPLLKDAGALWL